jgi:predicted GTPase
MELIPDWVIKVKREVPTCDFLFVGTKSDLLQETDPEEVRADVEKAFAHFQPKGCFVTSALKKEGIAEVFQMAAELFRPSDENITVNVPETAQEDDPKCC